VTKVLIVTRMMMTSPDFDVCGVVTEANFYQLWANFHRSLGDESFQLTSLGQDGADEN
jgi:hypothetical protein